MAGLEEEEDYLRILSQRIWGPRAIVDLCKVLVSEVFASGKR